ncbi:microtubule associated protein-domain-containing protein [Kockovaella imperatae]|uniref:Microtubule associated protein-domain-containing protein n=1 Tax=Kockovaella imperatae TaxID=4999 RepID=A0A1Y1UB14_9TREE|nr:microtubule associated protein-domain-containing protein [Kockovaella imperatae]ORX35209.1 microtubule associated protein-domain-containing protein [Kockovaella imperatae]
MAAYLAEHVQHLQSLHTLLGLPPDALKSDEAHIESAIREAVSTLISNREEEVESWKAKIEQAGVDLQGVQVAIGERAVKHHAVDSGVALPTQWDEMIRRRGQFEQSYQERMRRIDGLRSQIDALASLLGPPVEPALPPQPIASSSKGGPSPTWLAVGDDVLRSYEALLQRAIEERESRTQQLYDHFRDLLFFHVELALPSLPSSSSSSNDFPPSLMSKSGSNVETYRDTLSEYIRINAPAMNAGNEDEDEDWTKGLEGIEPDRSLIQWLEEMVAMWTAERDARISRIQELYDRLEPMWSRLEIDQETQDLFIEMNRGCGMTVISAYEDELERCMDLRRSSLSAFMVAARQELEELWNALLYSEEERREFGPFIDDDYTEELLLLHEEETERLKMEMESKVTLLPKVKEWHGLKLEEEELEVLANDPQRFSRRGGAMLREEKLRKRVGNLLPKVENDLLVLLPQWESEHQRPFTVNGISIVEQIYEAREAKEAAKEAKKRAKQGLAPTAALAPARSVKATPAVKIARGMPGSVMASAVSRKREAPTPTPFGRMGTVMKKQKTGLNMTSMKPAASAGGTRIPSGKSRMADPTSSPTPLPRADPGYESSRIPSFSLKAPAGRRQSFKPRQSQSRGLFQKLRQSMELAEEVDEVEIF